MASTKPSARGVSIASFTNMFTVGTVYALSILQTELPRLFDDAIPHSYSYSLSAALLAVASVLFSHGVGFSTLPGVIKSRVDGSSFAYEYGLVLTTWGLAGVVGSGIDALATPESGDFTAA
ncbi:uncharacterized protein DSM5745_03869 [Aspergillus mulundensis]|uniref:Uncharacterized protein n=1 Tax=Aspergillus mulundensis TaxID=1810919 RepID=A0A3D8SBA1_9EURO|nr:hypothetical protein DSM5745_03869 [Aspergillus mulundensis]RDW83543.1 hypothetical protein DSM5745_03869 [Aspergillus mulundensis]